MRVKFEYLHDLLLHDPHNTFSDYFAIALLKINEEFAELKGQRPLAMTKEVAEKKYLRYIATRSQGAKKESESDVAWTNRKKANLFDYAKY